MINFFMAAATCSSGKLFGFIPSWWEYLPKPTPPNCGIVVNNFPSDLWLIGLAVIDILLRVAGFVAVISIIIAGFEYVFSLGNSDKITNARKRIQNSLIGLGIAIIAVALVSFLGNALG